MQRETTILKIMLGMDSKETPVVTGSYAQEIREAVRRVQTGQLSETERKIAARSTKISHEYEAVWK